MATLAAPKAVSPMIRFCRYAALISGIAYGSFRLGYLQRKEVGIQDHENKIRTIRDTRITREKETAMNIEMGQLAVEIGIKAKST